MGKRIKIGIVYSYDENWIGGTYYYQNLIQSLALLPNEKKPHLVILSNNVESFDSVKSFNYPYVTYQLLHYIPESLFEKYRNKIKRKWFPNLPIARKKVNFGIDILFHPSETDIDDSIEKHLYWIPDFQEVHLPHLFDKEYLKLRKKKQEELLTANKHILFSSEDSYSDFKKLYPNAKSKCHVVNFSVFHPDFSDMNIEALKNKFNVESEIPYFFSPNQFWKHKNHIVILKALKKMKEKYDFKFQVVFSGKEFDHRNPSYFEELNNYVLENDLQRQVKFLGFIDRGEQLCFMKNALVVIQPSLFEGWSTVVEDAKAMNQNLIVSSLNVHKEQLGNKGYYFDPNDDNELMNQMIFFLENRVSKPEFNYSDQLKLFGEKFNKVIAEIV